MAPANYFSVCAKRVNPYNAELFFFKPWTFFQFEIIIYISVSSFWFIRIPMLWVFDHYKCFNSFNVGTVFQSQNLPSRDVR